MARHAPGPAGRRLIALGVAVALVAGLGDATRPASAQPASVSLAPGFNLVAAPAGGAPQDLVDALPAVQALHSWDHDAGSFRSWRRGAPEIVNSLDHVAAGEGLWVQANAPAGWPLAPAATVDTPSGAGFHLIGWTEAAVAAGDAFPDLRDYALFGWDAAEQAFTFFSPDLPDALQTLDLLEPGRAYWLRLEGAPPPAGGPAPRRGYLPRPCGFDLDDDGIAGEPSDCNVGDGVTADPDGDGVNEDILYVDCANGLDAAGRGAAAAPLRTIRFAYAQLDGPADGAEDIIAFRGVCAEGSDLRPTVAGVPGARVKPASGSEAWPFEFPTNPTMLIGWDFDNDGAYPPFDRDDLAVLEGDPDGLLNGNGAAYALKLNDPVDNSYIEFAHFEVRNYGRDTDALDAGFVKPNAFPENRSHAYFHDLSLHNINRDRPLGGGLMVVNFFNIRDLRYLALINVESLDTGAYFTRGGGEAFDPDARDARFFRFQNITYTAHGCDDTNANGAACSGVGAAAVTVSKVWSYVSGFEFIDSIWDANVNAWIPQASGGPAGANGVGPSQCSQDWVVRNNHFIDFKQVLIVQPESSGSCTAFPRPVRNVTFDGNLVTSTYEPWEFGDLLVDIRGGAASELAAAEDITISNNIFAVPVGVGAFVRVITGTDSGTPPGTIRIAGNTFIGDSNRFAAIFIADSGQANPHPRIVLHDNIVLSPGGPAVWTEYAPSGWDADNNVFAPGSSFSWNDGPETDLSAWRAASGGDAGSRLCTPAFVDALNFDYHLDRADTCARNAGGGAGGVAAVDFDGEPRPQGGWDAGADEVP